MSNNKDFKVKNGIQPTAYHEAVGTVVSETEGYYLAGASYDSKSFSVASQETVPIGLAFNDDGTAIFVVGYSGDAVFKYTLSTAYDISTASYTSTYSVASQATDASGVMFNPSGTKMYVTNNGTPTALFQYTLPTAFDITTATYDSVTFDFSTQDGSVFNPRFNSDGTKLYVAGNAGDSIYQYSLPTAYDISTMSYDSVSLSVSALDATPVAAVFNDTGTVMYLLGGTNNTLFEYSLSTAYDISTASYTSTSFTFTSQDTAVRGVVFKPDGTKMYAVGVTGDTIYQYSTALNTASLDLSTGSVFEITPTSDIQVSLSNPAASGTVSGATLLLTASGTAYTITYDTSIQWDGGTAPTSPAIDETDVITFSTRDGGTSYSAALAIDGAQ